MSQVIIGIDLGGTFVKSAIVSQEKKVLAKDSRPTNAEAGPSAVLDAMADSARDLMNQVGIGQWDVLAVGIGTPGPLNWQTGIVYSTPNMPGWENVPVTEEMEKRLGVPCFLDNDANAACYGEYWLGAGQGTDSMAVFTLGTGVGGGMVVFGQLLRGIDGTAAELGHLKMQRDGRMCGCGSRGCLEAYASVTGMTKTAIEGLEAGKESKLTELCGGDFKAIDGEMIFNAAESGDEFAAWVFNETAIWLGLGIASIINLQNPERVVLCGGMIDAGERLFAPVRETAKANSFAVPGSRCQIIPAGLGGDAGVIGAAGCALARKLETNETAASFQGND